MDFVRGSVVRSLAGHDKGGLFLVLEIEERYAVICDGKRRSLEKPKRKNILHLAPVSVVVNEDSMKTNRAIRNIIRSFGPSAAENTR